MEVGPTMIAAFWVGAQQREVTVRRPVSLGAKPVRRGGSSAAALSCAEAQLSSLRDVLDQRRVVPQRCPRGGHPPPVLVCEQSDRL